MKKLLAVLGLVLAFSSPAWCGYISTPNTGAQTNTANSFAGQQTITSGGFVVSGGSVTFQGPFGDTSTVTLGGAGNQVTISSNAVIGDTTFYSRGVPLTNSCGYIIGSVVQSSQTTQIAAINAFSNTTYAAVTGFKASITPLCATDVVEVSFSGSLSNTAGNSVFASVRRGTTDLDSTGNGFGQVGSGTLALNSDFSADLIDSPATVSSTTWTVQYRVNAGSGNWNPNAVTHTLLLKEIAR